MKLRQAKDPGVGNVYLHEKASELKKTFHKRTKSFKTALPLNRSRHQLNIQSRSRHHFRKLRAAIRPDYRRYTGAVCTGSWRRIPGEHLTFSVTARSGQTILCPFDLPAEGADSRWEKKRRNFIALLAGGREIAYKSFIDIVCLAVIVSEVSVMGNCILTQFFVPLPIVSQCFKKL